jgi:hypothetical protein
MSASDWRQGRSAPSVARCTGLTVAVAMAAAVVLVSSGSWASATPVSEHRLSSNAVIVGTQPAPTGSAPAATDAHASGMRVATPTGYDLVGSDGGVFAFGGGFYGSLPGLGVHVTNIVGIVSSSDFHGYFLVGSDGGVFALGDAPFEGSLPGLGVHVNDIVGIVPSGDNQGYFLVGADGGVFAFGDSQYEGSVPGSAIHVTDVASIASTPDSHGYWVLGSDGTIYNFGTAKDFGNATSDLPFVGIASTNDGQGIWVTDDGGDVGVPAGGDAKFFGDLGSLPVFNIVSIVPTGDNGGYWLVGSDGGVFAFGDAPSLGSLPGLNVHVGNVVGGVPT